MSTADQRPRVAIVTGGSGGIGRASAKRLAQDGYAVVVHYAGNQGAADAAVNDVATAGGQGVAIQADVADENAVKALFDQAEEHVRWRGCRRAHRRADEARAVGRARSR